MGGRIDPPGHAGDDQHPLRTQFRGQDAGEPLPGGGGDPRADHGNGGAGQKLAIPGQPKHRRGRFRRGQQGRIVAVAEHHQPGPGALTGVDFPLGLGPGHRSQGVQASAPAGQLRQGFEGPSGGSEPLDQGMEGDGTDLIGPGQSEAIDAFVCVRAAQGGLAGSAPGPGVGAGAALAPILGS